jgi:hypothetical protein
LTLNYDALLSTTLFNYRKTLEDNISTGNAFFWWLKNKRERGYKGVDNIGERIQIPLMYELGRADFYSGYDLLDTTPMDGITSAFYDWRQMAVPISISRKEERQNSNEAQIIDLLESKIEQAELGIQELFGKALLQGNLPTGGSPIVPYVSAANGASGFDPLGKAVTPDPTAALTYGNIAQNTYTWWRNQFKSFTGITTNAAYRTALTNLYNNCSKGPGGPPDFALCDQGTYEQYETYLASYHRNPDYGKADIPFENIKFKGSTIMWDEFIADYSTPGAMTTNKGCLFFLNMKFWEMRYDKQTNFISDPFQRPVNQDAKTSHILWLGAACTSNRRKHGIGFNIPKDTVLT